MGSINGQLYSLFGLRVAKVKFDSKFGGVDQCLQKGAQLPILGHLGHDGAPNLFWTILAMLNMN